MNIYVILRKGPKDFYAGLLDGVVNINANDGSTMGFRLDKGDLVRNIWIDKLGWKPYKKFTAGFEIQDMMKKAEKQFITLKEFCDISFPEDIFTTEAIEYFTKQLYTFTSARQIWVHKKGSSIGTTVRGL
jgi:hypothetical protein